MLASASVIFRGRKKGKIPAIATEVRRSETVKNNSKKSKKVLDILVCVC